RAARRDARRPEREPPALRVRRPRRVRPVHRLLLRRGRSGGDDGSCCHRWSLPPLTAIAHHATVTIALHGNAPMPDWTATSIFEAYFRPLYPPDLRDDP